MTGNSEPRWWNGIHSDTAAPFLEPERPGLGESARVRLRTPRTTPVTKVFVRAIIDGVDQYFAAEERESGLFRWYEALLPITQRFIHYHFFLLAERPLYYNRAGVSRVYPGEEADFSVDLDHHVPGWVSSAVFYQIFPDRFCRGDAALGVRTGELSRGPFSSREMNWDEIPLRWEEGGSLDFFNGDLPGITARLDYLQQLGVNALYLTPIFTAGTNHRYDCLDYFSVDSHLGGDEALVELVAELHRRQMRIMLDVSINHIGVEHPWAESPMILRRADGSPVNWMGVPELLKLDYRVPELRDRIYRDEDSVVQRYLRPPFNIDGWRFDVASEVARHGESQQGLEVWREIRHVIRRINPDAYILGEHWHDSQIYLQGDCWDSAMNYFASARPLRTWTGELDRFASVPAAEARLGAAPAGTELARMIDQHFQRIPSGAVHGQFNLIDSHDVTRLHNNNDLFDFDLYVGVVMLLFLLPGTVSIYYGDEIGLSGTLDGDHGKRHPMRWDPGFGDPQFRDLYRTMIALKRSSPVLRQGSARVLAAGETHLIYGRFTTDEAVVLILNRKDEPQKMEVDLATPGAQTCRDAITGGEFMVSTAGYVTVSLPPRKSLLLRCCCQGAPR